MDPEEDERYIFSVDEVTGEGIEPYESDGFEDEKESSVEEGQETRKSEQGCSTEEFDDTRSQNVKSPEQGNKSQEEGADSSSQGRSEAVKTEDGKQKKTKYIFDNHRVDSSVDFTCRECGNSFKCRLDVVKHSLEEHGRKVYPCGKCPLFLSKPSYLRNHMARHVEVSPYVCEKCSKSFSRKKYYVRHLLVHTEERPYKCEFCEFKGKSKGYVRLHVRNRHEKKPFKCALCDLTFMTLLEVNTHFAFHRNENQTDLCSEIHSEKLVVVANKAKDLKCTYCNRKFYTTEEVNAHMANCLRKEKWRGLAAMFKCSICDRSYRNKSNLGEHMRVKHGQGGRPRYVATIKVKAPGSEGLNNNIQEVQGDSGIHVALPLVVNDDKSNERISGGNRKAGRAFKTVVGSKQSKVLRDKSDESAMRNDVRKNRRKEIAERHLAHGCTESDDCRFCLEPQVEVEPGSSTSSERPFVCQKCKMSFKTNSGLWSHRFVHVSERPFQCDKCGNTFKLKKRLTRHIKSHNSEKAYTCEICGKGYAGLTEYKYHVLAHEKNFVCNECGNVYSREQTLKLHVIRNHGAGTKVSCSVCNKVLKYKKLLFKHMNLHC